MNNLLNVENTELRLWSKDVGLFSLNIEEGKEL